MAPAQYVLKIVQENGEKHIPIKDTLLIGRDEKMDLYLENPSVSSKHAAIYLKKGIAYIEDFGSTNGTFVNGSSVTAVVPLKNNDVVTIGDCKCLFINTMEKIKKYITVSLRQTKEQHVLKIFVADKKLNAHETLQAKAQTNFPIQNGIKVIPHCEGSFHVPKLLDLDIASPCSIAEIQVMPLRKKELQMSLSIHKNNNLLQSMTIPLKHYANYAHKCIRLAIFLPLLFFFLDGVTFKTHDCPFIIATFLKIIYTLGGFTMTGILVGIVFMGLGVLLYSRAQEINIYSQEIQI